MRHKLEGRYKVLLTNGYYVDHTMLHEHDEVFASTSPRLLPVDTTIESLIEIAEQVAEFLPTGGYEQYAKNVRKCELVTIEIKIIED